VSLAPAQSTVSSWRAPTLWCRRSGAGDRENGLEALVEHWREYGRPTHS
jgi:hypothetical protein